ncbi:MAG: arylesterase [Acidobacteria bacterium]|nr:arylesterase [Acidobacteriota bacterium]
MRRRHCLVVLVAVVLGVAGCQREAPDAGTAASSTPAHQTRTPASSPERPRVVAFGDSLTAGLGLAPDLAWPALVQREADEAGLDVEIVNAGVSGDTTAGGVRRLDWALDGDVRVLVLELGANDGLRGLPVAQMRDNLAQMIRVARDRNIAVLLCGMEAPPNFGPQYTREFRQVYVELGAQDGVTLLPFFLDGVAGNASLNQPDGIHPNEEGTRRVADLVWQFLQPVIARALASS